MTHTSSEFSLEGHWLSKLTIKGGDDSDQTVAPAEVLDDLITSASRKNGGAYLQNESFLENNWNISSQLLLSLDKCLKPLIIGWKMVPGMYRE